MGWRRGRPVDALTAPAETITRTGPTELDSAAARLAAPAIECRTIEFVPDTGNAGTVYIGGPDVSSASGFPVPDVGVVFNVNQSTKEAIYGIADTSGDAVRWISIL